jgi:ABC-type multidrug transport system fused ATPase/permease subunit
LQQEPTVVGLTRVCFFVVLAAALLSFGAASNFAQETGADLKEKAQETVEKAKETLDTARDKADEVAKKVDEDENAREVAAGILKPIYQLAEKFSFPWFHWIAFSVMVAGVVSFALQLTLGKLLVLAKAGFSPAEILSDALGLVVSVVGLVLTTQAATENSTFTSSAASVLSASIVGGVAGLIFYVWGQRQELQAVEGRRKVVVTTTTLPK